MIEPKYNVELRGFTDDVVDPTHALMRGFGVSAARAETILERLPAVVKRRAKHLEALRYATALHKLGADVVVRDEASGVRVSLDELASFDPKQPGIIASADPGAKGSQVPRAAFRSGSHPTISFPKTAAGVAVTPASLTALTHLDDETEHEARSPQGVSAGHDVGRAAAASGSETPLVRLEQDLPPGGLGAGVLRPRSGPREAVESLELDENLIPAGRLGSTVPAMPEVLSAIRDFEATGWEPMRPDIGLGFAPPDTPWRSPRDPVSGELARASTGAHRGSVDRVERAPTSPLAQRVAGRPGSTPRAGRPGTQTIIVGLLVAGLVAAAIFLGARWLGGVSSELEQRLRAESQRYLPELEVRDISGGSIGRQQTEDRQVAVRLGACYGWIATTDDTGCDLDLYVYRSGPGSAEGQGLTADIEYDNLPVVFHCPDADGELTVRVSNAGAASCDYGLASLQGLGSVGWPLEPYLGFYARLLSLGGFGGPYEPVGEIRHGTLSAGQSDRLDLIIPAGRCYNVLGVVQQGLDLDARLLIDGDVVSSDELVDNFPIVGHCAGASDVRAEVELVMFAGSSSYVWQTFEGPPLN